MASKDRTRTIGDEIRRLASEKGASATFVEHLVEFFHSKQVPLTDPVEPYWLALEEAFSLEESVRRNTTRARENLVRLQDCLRLVGATYQQQLNQLRRVRESLDAQTRIAREGTDKLRELSRGKGSERRATTAAPTRAVVLVPGPRDLQ
jgi:hypothetical protein